MGMSYETFMSLTHNQFIEAHDAWLIKVKADREHHELTAYRVARWHLWRTLCPPDQDKISEYDLLLLPGEEKPKEETKEVKSTRERFETLAEKWK